MPKLFINLILLSNFVLQKGFVILYNFFCCCCLFVYLQSKIQLIIVYNSLKLNDNKLFFLINDDHKKYYFCI